MFDSPPPQKWMLVLFFFIFFYFWMLVLVERSSILVVKNGFMLFLLWHVVRRIFTLRHTPETSFTNTSYTLILSIPFCPFKKKIILIMPHKNDFTAHLGVTIWKHWDSASEIGLESCLLWQETFMLNLSESRAATGRLRGKSHFHLPSKWHSGADVGGRWGGDVTEILAVLKGRPCFLLFILFSLKNSQNMRTIKETRCFLVLWG